MTRYAVGDIQGCLQPLQCLLERVEFDPACDQLWAVGDLINRGPASLATLRFLKSLQDKHTDSLRLVLGNHDLHFLAVARGFARSHHDDTITEILDAADSEELQQWLLQQPLLYSDPSGDFSMVHAGIAPQWTLAQANSYARELEAVLRSPQVDDFFANMYGNQPAQWRDELSGWPRLRLITNYFTRMRFCTAAGQLDLANKSEQHPDPEFAPWFSFSERQTRKDNIIFGHWAALQGCSDGYANSEQVFALDTGCVWGAQMTLMNLETRELHRCACSA